MRISFVLPAWFDVPVGGYKVVYEYSNYLSGKGHEVFIIYPKTMGEVNNNGNKRNYLKRKIRGVIYNLFNREKITWFPISDDVKLIFVPDLSECYIPKADAIFATAWDTSEWVSIYSADKGNKFYLIQSHEIWSGTEDRVNRTFKLPLCKVVISKWLKELLATLGEKENIIHIPNAIDLKSFKIINPISSRNPMRVGMLYNRHWYKGSTIGIEALKLVKSKHPNLEVVFFSTFSPGQEVPGWVEFCQNPPQETLVNLYNSFSLFVCPSLLEGWALPPAEAMVCGCALVASDIGGVKDYAIHGETALLSPPNNPEALAGNILTLLENNELRVKIAEQGNEYIKRFSWEDSSDKLEALLKSKL